MTEAIVLQTQRLELRSITEDDWDLYRSLEMDDDIMKYDSSMRPEAEVRERFESRLPKWDKTSQQWLCLVIIEKETGRKVGVTGFYPEWEPYQQAEVAFMLLHEFQGKGYGTESLKPVIDYAFMVCQFNKVRATVTKGNDVSARLLEKCGFLLEGTIRENYKINGQWCDDILYGILKSEYGQSSLCK